MLHIILGCMYSGKTTQIIAEYNKFKNSGAKCLMITPLGRVESHDSVTVESISVDKNSLILTNIDLVDVICIDEGQFFFDLIPFAYLCRKKNKSLIVNGLNGDFKGRIFGDLVHLIPHASKVTYLTSKCKCGDIAMYSKRLSNNQVLISINEDYEPSCFECINSSARE